MQLFVLWIKDRFTSQFVMAFVDKINKSIYIIILDSEKFLLIVECLNYPNPTITAILILVKHNS